MTDSAVQIPGFIAGTWAIDPNRSEVPSPSAIWS